MVTIRRISMDWYSWLSRTNLDPSLTYEYGLVLTRSELDKEDMIYFDHDFLLSLGIKVAKHRLEILKLVHKEIGKTPNGFGKLILALSKTKKFFSKNITKWISHRNSAHMIPLELSNYSKPLKGALRRLNSGKEVKKEKSLVECKNAAKSGPLDRGVIEQMMMTDKWISISGPLDGKFYQEKVMYTNRSPTRYSQSKTDGKWGENFGYGNKSPSSYRPWQGKSPSPLVSHYNGGNVADGDGNHSPWSLMFQDMKPT